MKINFTKIIDKFISTKPHSMSADGWENPFASPNGHIVVSETENMKKRMGRLGQIKTAYINKVTLTQNTAMNVLPVTPTDGFVAIPYKIIMSISGPGLLYLDWQQQKGQTGGTNGADNIFTKYMTGAGSWELDLSGEVMVGNGGFINLVANPDGTGTFAWASIIYAEEME